MVVIAMDHAPEQIRGEMTRWFLELKPGVFVGNVNARIRDLLWERICEAGPIEGAVAAWPDKSEQGFYIKMTGSPRRCVEDFDGVRLILVK